MLGSWTSRLESIQTQHGRKSQANKYRQLIAFTVLVKRFQCVVRSQLCAPSERVGSLPRIRPSAAT
eukprot:6292967-Amphidinium_carterae.1